MILMIMESQDSNAVPVWLLSAGNARSETIVPNQVTNLVFCSRVNLFKVGKNFYCCFLKV